MKLNLNRFSLRTKLLVTCLGVGLVPAVVITIATWLATERIAGDIAKGYQSIALNIADKIDRNLFERYGDVQAFGLNKVVQDRDAWYVVGEENPIARAMNQYVDLYDCYYLTLLIDPSGKLIAVNSRDSEGKPLKTASLYERDFATETWFHDAVTGKFYDSKDGSVTGSVVEHLYVDELVKNIYRDEGLALGFTAPVRDADGNIIAVWKNVAKFSVVEEIFPASFQALKNRGLGTAELTLLDEQGSIIVDYDPIKNGTEDILRNTDIIGKLNLAQKNVEAAVRVVAGESGSIVRSWHARKKIYQCAGFTPLQGALGFPGMKWNVMVRVATGEALTMISAIRTTVGIILGIAAVIIAVISLLIVRTLVRPITGVIGNLRQGSEEVESASSQVTQASDSLANGAVAQSDSIEETVNSTNRLSEMAKQNASRAGEANELTGKARQSAQAGTEVMEELQESINAIDKSTHEVGKVLRTIEDIAFQTNLLALNAAIEAEGAGESGKRFAVVADEVRKLAERCGQAAKDTAKLIEEAITTTQQGVTHCADSTKVFASIIQQVNEVSELVEKIDEGNREQATEADQINAEISKVGQITDNNSAAAEESAGAAKELTSQAEVLNTVVQDLVVLVQGQGKVTQSVSSPNEGRNYAGYGN